MFRFLQIKQLTLLKIYVPQNTKPRFYFSPHTFHQPRWHHQEILEMLEISHNSIFRNNPTPTLFLLIDPKQELHYYLG